MNILYLLAKWAQCMRVKRRGYVSVYKNWDQLCKYVKEEGKSCTLFNITFEIPAGFALVILWLSL
jgi:hypothetical protein